MTDDAGVTHSECQRQCSVLRSDYEGACRAGDAVAPGACSKPPACIELLMPLYVSELTIKFDKLTTKKSLVASANSLTIS
jgi:hypothetical protein